jgi:hypothetical protein
MIKNKKIRVGIVGPDDSIKKIKAIAITFSEAVWTFFEYSDVNNALDLVISNINDVDVFLLTGEVPYNMVMQSKHIINKPLHYVPHTGTALYRTLLEMTIHHQKSLARISIDTVSQEDVMEVYNELGIPFSQIYIKSLDSDPGTWGEAHLELWKQNKIDAVITSLSETSNFLLENKVPVFRIRPTQSIIRSCLKSIIDVSLLQDAQKGQILIQLINIDRYINLIHYLGSEYDAQKIQLELYKRLLDYAREVEGSFTSLGKDTFLLITTQGAYQKYTEGKLMNPIPEWVLENLPISISIGIGEGRSGIEAETHARIALKHAQENGGDCCFFTSLIGEVNGPLGREELMSFSYQLEGEMLQIAKQAGISPATFGKVAYVLKKSSKNELSAVELAQYLKITPRQARRILIQLESIGIAKRIGEESLSVSGRPRIIYEINLKI